MTHIPVQSVNDPSKNKQSVLFKQVRHNTTRTGNSLCYSNRSENSLCYSNRPDTILPEQETDCVIQTGQTQYFQNRKQSVLFKQVRHNTTRTGNSLCYSNRSDTILPEQETVCVIQTGQTQYYQNRKQSVLLKQVRKQSVLLIQVRHNTTRTGNSLCYSNRSDTILPEQETVCVTQTGQKTVCVIQTGQTQYYQNRKQSVLFKQARHNTTRTGNSLCYSNRPDKILPEQETVCVIQTGQTQYYQNRKQSVLFKQVRHNTTRTGNCVIQTGQTQYYQNRKQSVAQQKTGKAGSTNNPVATNNTIIFGVINIPTATLSLQITLWLQITVG